MSTLLHARHQVFEEGGQRVEHARGSLILAHSRRAILPTAASALDDDPTEIPRPL
jgi:hypothetical protein